MHMVIACLAGLVGALAPPEDIVKLFEERTVVYSGGDYNDETFKWRLLAPNRSSRARSTR